MASYQLDAVYDASAHQIHGTGRLTYRNPSSDSLGELWFHQYLNAFRSPDTPWLRESTDAHRGHPFDAEHPGWIDVEALVLEDGTPLALEAADAGGGGFAGIRREATIARVALPSPLGPGQTISLRVRWTAQLPRLFARTGFFDDTKSQPCRLEVPAHLAPGAGCADFVMAGQWYPKLAVYQRGVWDTEPWHANAEFFADFGSYDVSITLPEPYVVGSSGLPVGEEHHSDGTKTVRYRAESVTDVAWTAWPGYARVQAVAQVSGGPIDLDLLLPQDERGLANRHLEAARAALDAYGTWYGPYPWSRLTVVVPPAGADGAGGMEYPTLVTTRLATRLPFGLQGLHDVELITAHEIAHQWFPMQVQSNEAAEPWLDEGFADYLTLRLLERRYGRERAALDVPFLRLGYETAQRAVMATGGIREPLAQSAAALPESQRYGATIYAKGSLALLGLERTLGDGPFTDSLRGYVNRWRWRHPTIADLRETLEDEIGSSSLGWFFEGLVYGSGTVDYALERDGETLRLQRRGGVAQPVTDSGLTLDLNPFDQATGGEAGEEIAAAVRWGQLVQAIVQLLGMVG